MILQSAINCMQRYSDDEEVQLLASVAIQRHLQEHDDDDENSWECPRDVFASIFLCINRQNRTIVASACEIMAALLHRNVPTHSKHLFAIDNAIEQLLFCMSVFMESEEIQLPMCSIWRSLFTLQDRTINQLFTRNEGLRMIVDSATRYCHNKILVEDALFALTDNSFMRSDDVDNTLLFPLGHFAVRELQDDAVDNHNLKTAALHLVLLLCGRGDYFKDLFSHCHTIPCIVSLMNQHLMESELQKAACTCLWVLASFHDNKRLIGRCGGIRAIVNAMNAHLDAPRLLKEALTALKNLSSEHDNKIWLCRCDAEDVVIRVIQTHTDSFFNDVVVASGMAAWNNIVVDNQTRTVSQMKPGTLEVILQAMRRFEANETVQRNATLLLKSFSFHHDNLLVMATSVDYVEELLNPLTAVGERLPDCRDRVGCIIGKIEEAGRLQLQRDQESQPIAGVEGDDESFEMVEMEEINEVTVPSSAEAT